MLQRLGSRLQMKAIFLQQFQPKSYLTDIKMSFSSCKSNLQEKANIVKLTQSVRDKGFLAFYTLYGIKHIDLQKLLSKKQDFITIRQMLLQQKQLIKYHQKKKKNQKKSLKRPQYYKPQVKNKSQKIEENILRANADQFFSALQIGEGITLQQDIFYQLKIGKPDQQAFGKSVFNVTSITKRVLQFVLSDTQILRGNRGIGKAWAHSFINYLSINMWRYLVKQQSLQSIYKLVELNIKLFKNISINNGDQEKANEITPSSVVKSIRVFPFQLFLQLHESIKWLDIINILHLQCPEIQIPFTIKPQRQQNQNDAQYDKRIYQYESVLLDKYLTKISQAFKKHRNFLQLVLNINQADIYFRKIGLIVRLRRKTRCIRENRLFQEAQRQIILSKMYQDWSNVQKQAIHLQKVLKVLYLSSIGTKIKWNCSQHLDQDGVKQVTSQKRSYCNYYNMFKHQAFFIKQLKYGKQLSLPLEQKQMWSNLWFQIQRNIFQAVNLRHLNSIKNLKYVFKKLGLRMSFNSIFYQINVETEYPQIHKINPLDLRTWFDKNDQNHKFLTFKIFIQEIKDKCKNFLKKRSLKKQQKQHNLLIQQNYMSFQLRQQLKQLWKNSKQTAYNLLRNLTLQILKQIPTKNQQCTKDRSVKQFFFNTTIKIDIKKTIFLLKLKQMFKNRAQSRQRQIDKEQFIISQQQVEQLLIKLLMLTDQAAKKQNQQILSDAEIILRLLIDQQYMKIIKNKQQKNELLIKQSFSKFSARLQNIRVDNEFKEYYIIYLHQSGLIRVNQQAFNQIMTQLLSSQQLFLIIGKYKFNIVNQQINNFIDFNIQSPLRIQQLKLKKCIKKQNNPKRHYFEEAVKTLKEIKDGETLGFRSVTEDGIYSKTSKCFNLLLVRKGCIFYKNRSLNKYRKKKKVLLTINATLIKDQIFTIDFSLGRDVEHLRPKIKKVTEQFYNVFIKGNKYFSKKYEYKHIIICLNSVYKYIYNLPDIPSFIEIVPLKEFKFDQNHNKSLYRLLAEIELQEYQRHL